MKSKYSAVFLALLLLFTAFPFVVPVFADGENWLDGWGYRKSLTFSGSGSAGTDYQMKIIVDYGSGSDSDDTVYLDGKCETDFVDIRFTEDDGDTELDYWIEEKTDSDSAVFWVEVADSLNSGQSPVIYVYYGNDAVSSTSDGDATFLFFDDFDDASLSSDDWNIQGSPSESGSVCSFDNDDGVYSKSTFGAYDVAVKSRAKADEQDVMFASFANSFNPAPEPVHSAQIYVSDYDADGDYDRISCYSSVEGADENTGADGTDFRNTYYTYEIKWLSSSSVKYYQNGLLLTERVTCLPSVASGVGFRAWDSSQESTLDVDWVFVRNCIDSEPYVSSWGSEETESDNLFYLTFYHNNATMGDFYVNCTNIANGTTLNYTEGENITLIGVVFANYTFLNFNLNDTSNVTTNPYNYNNITANATLYCNFATPSSESGPGYTPLVYVALAVAVLGFSWFVADSKK